MITVHGQIVDPESGKVVADSGQIDDYDHIERVWSVVMSCPDSFTVSFDEAGPHISRKGGCHMIKIHDQIVDPESGEVIAEPGVILDDLGIDRVLSLAFQFPEYFKVLALLPEGYTAGADNPFDFEIHIHSFIVPLNLPDIEATLNHFAEQESPI